MSVFSLICVRVLLLFHFAACVCRLCFDDAIISSSLLLLLSMH